MNLKFELHKVAREISLHGKRYQITRTIKDEYNEDTDGVEVVGEVLGLFHTEKGYIHRSIADGSDTRAKGQPKLLLLYKDVEKIQNGDLITIQNKRYKINDINNIELFNIVCDLSLEVIIYGNS